MTVLGRRNFLKNGLFAGTAWMAFKQEVQSSRLKSDPDFWKLVKSQFCLKEDLTYLNTGSLGPSPLPVVEATEKFRRILEGFPSKYMWGGWNDSKEEVRVNIASMFGVEPDEIALTHNTTEGMNLIASSLDLQPGDEVILADHEHHTGTLPWKFFQESKGVRLIRPKLPILPDSPDQLVEVYRNEVTDRTKVISMCHMVNTNGMILPIKEIVNFASPKGILVGVDGAQTPGMLEINLKDLGCDFFATSAHKWLLGPKGMGVFYARGDQREKLRPLIVSGMYYLNESCRKFENYNTRNLPELLGLGAAVEFRNLIGGTRIQDRIYELKHYFREQISDLEFLHIKTPGDDSMSAGITVVEVLGADVREIQQELMNDFNIDCRAMTSHRLNSLRISLGLCVIKSDIDLLVRALKQINA